MDLVIERLPSPIGEIFVVSDGEFLRAVDFEDYEQRMLDLLKRHYGQVSLRPGKNPAVISEGIRAYLAGDLTAIDDIQVASNGTEFQQTVWTTLRDIPAGETWSYGQLAKVVGNPKASRAVGLANGSNPIPIVLPCHRVIGANGSLTGYGGGMERKRWLLAHEGVQIQSTLF